MKVLLYIYKQYTCGHHWILQETSLVRAIEVVFNLYNHLELQLVGTIISWDYN